MEEIVVATEDTLLFTTLQSELGCLGFEVHWALDGHEAYEFCSTGNADAIFIDAAIQIYSLWELCTLLREHPDVSPDLAIFIITDNELNSTKLRHFRISEVLRRAHDVAHLREMLARV